MLVVNLDTSHISQIAREHLALESLIGRDDVTLCFSLLQLTELSAPIQSTSLIRAVLADAPLVFTNPRELVYCEECAVACEILFEAPKVRLPRVFVKRLPNLDTLRDGQSTVLDYFDHFVDDEQGRQRMLAAAEFGANLSNQHRSDGAIITDRLSHVTRWLRDYLEMMRVHVPEYGGGMTAEQIIRQLGGDAKLPTTFPLFAVHQRLSRARVQNKPEGSDRNDVIDEYIACYAPYAAVTSLDRGTYHRFNEAKLPAAARVVKELSALPDLLAKVRNGELSPIPSSPFQCGVRQLPS